MHKMFCKYLIMQFQSEFTQKLLFVDVPNYELNDPHLFAYYKQLFSYYSRIDIAPMNKSFSAYMHKLITTILPYKKAKYLLSHVFIFDKSTKTRLLNHSMVANTHRYIQFWNSQHFIDLIMTMSGKNGRSAQSNRRNTVRVNSGFRELSQELNFGQFLVKLAQFKSPL